MDNGSGSKLEATAVREIDFSSLVHEYVAARDGQAPRDVRKAGRPVAA